MNIFLLLGLISLTFQVFPEFLKILSSNYPLSYTGNVFIDEENNLYLVNSGYNSIQKYNEDGKFVFSWNASCRFSRISVKYQNNIFHVFCLRDGFYYQYNMKGKLIFFKEMSLEKIVRLWKGYPYIQDERINIVNNFFNPYVVFHREDGQVIKIKSPWYWWIIKYPFPGLFFLITGILITFFKSDLYQKKLKPNIKKKNFYKI